MRATRWLGLLAIYVGAQSLALALALPFRASGVSSGASGTNPFTPLVLIAAVVIVPLIILFVARRHNVFAALRAILLIAIGGALYLALIETLVVVFPQYYLLPNSTTGLLAIYPAIPVGAAIAVTLFLALLMEPQWYIVDSAGFVAAAAVIAILGGSFAILPVLILLVGLAVYDYIAVYRTKHMLKLADLAVDMKLPILLVMPEDAGYDYPAAPTLSEIRSVPPEERGALFMGLGDIVIPGVLVVSAFVWLPSTPDLAGLPSSLWVAIGALVGSVIGYGVLMRYVLRGNAQAGLPLLNGGAIAGFLLTYIAVYHSFGFGLTGAL